MNRKPLETLYRDGRESGWSRGLQELINDWLPAGPLTMAEIGCATGESTVMFLESGKIGLLYAVDAWRDDVDAQDPLVSQYPAAEQEALFDRRMAPFGARLRKLKGLSTARAVDIPDGSCDFVYIDACHLYEAVLADLYAYIPKVRAGGLIGGHDFGHCWIGTVGRAVRELLGEPDRIFSDTSWIKRR